jgi:arylsulfatase A
MKYVYVTVLFFCLIASADKKPNILFIMIDDLGWKDLHCQGNNNLNTPNIDKFASQGMRFTDAYAAAPVCTPTRAAAITGLYPARLNITQHGEDNWGFYKEKNMGPGKSTGILAASYKTVAERFQENGYHTAFIGKWHLSGHQFNESNKKNLPDNQGFDINIAGNGWGGPGGVGGFFSPYSIPNLKPGPKGEYMPDRLADEAIKLMKGYAKSEKPFFMCLWHYTVHWPIEAPEELYRKYSKGKPSDVQRYQAMIEGMDNAVGKTLKALDDLKIADNTLVIFTSDNGHLSGYTSGKPLRESKGYLYEGGIRVPLIIRWPGKVKQGVVNNTPAITIDHAPTFLEAAGIEYNKKDFDGLSLVKEISGKAPLNRDAIYFHYPHYAFHRRNDMGSVIRQGNLKLIHLFEKNKYELYDLSKDISESNNLIKQLPEKASEMKRKLAAWKKKVEAMDPRPLKNIEAGELKGKKPNS